MERDLDFSRRGTHQSGERGEENDIIQMAYWPFSWKSKNMSCITGYYLGRKHCGSAINVFKIHCQRDSPSSILP